MVKFYDYKTYTEVYTNKDAINTAIKNILLTRKGSIPGKPTFGSNLYKVVFEQIDHIIKSLIKSYVIEAILEFEPRVRVTQVEVKEIPEYNRILIKVQYEYFIEGYSASETVTIKLKD